jgi:hypothetical protein
MFDLLSFSLSCNYKITFFFEKNVVACSMFCQLSQAQPRQPIVFLQRQISSAVVHTDSNVHIMSSFTD